MVTVKIGDFIYSVEQLVAVTGLRYKVMEDRAIAFNNKKIDIHHLFSDTPQEVPTGTWEKENIPEPTGYKPVTINPVDQRMKSDSGEVTSKLHGNIDDKFIESNTKHNSCIVSFMKGLPEWFK